MTGSEFVNKLKKLAKKHKVKFVLDQRRGKGSHSTIFYGDKFTIIVNLKTELKIGTYNAMLKQLNISDKDLRG